MFGLVSHLVVGLPFLLFSFVMANEPGEHEFAWIESGYIIWCIAVYALVFWQKERKRLTIRVKAALVLLVSISYGIVFVAYACVSKIQINLFVVFVTANVLLSLAIALSLIKRLKLIPAGN